MDMRNEGLLQLDIDTMYHYCSLESFCSIIKNRELWLTRTDYTNDKYEMQYIDHQMVNIVSELVEEKAIKKESLDEIINFYENNNWYGKMYIGCFSKTKENLSQWRLYSDDAKGVSIGFSTPKLSCKLVIKPELSILMSGYVGYKVKYFNDEMREKIKKDIMVSIEKDGHYEIKIEDFIRYKENNYIKGDEFKYEEEYRILYNPKQKNIGNACFDVDDEFYKEDKMDFRLRSGKLIPYWKMPIKDTINEVVLGSKCDVNAEEVKNFLRKYGFYDVYVNKSDLSYV